MPHEYPRVSQKAHLSLHALWSTPLGGSAVKRIIGSSTAENGGHAGRLPAPRRLAVASEEEEEEEEEAALSPLGVPLGDPVLAKLAQRLCSVSAMAASLGVKEALIKAREVLARQRKGSSDEWHTDSRHSSNPGSQILAASGLFGTWSKW